MNCFITTVFSVTECTHMRDMTIICFICQYAALFGSKTNGIKSSFNLTESIGLTKHFSVSNDTDVICRAYSKICVEWAADHFSIGF